MSITYERVGLIEIDDESLAKAISAAAIGHILNRNMDGLDIDDRPFGIPAAAARENYTTGGPYSDSYKAQLRKAGKFKAAVDHRLSGLMLSQVRVLQITRGPAGVEIQIGVGSAGSRNIIAARHQALRKWLGISPKGMKAIRASIERAKAFKSKASGETRQL